MRGKRQNIQYSLALELSERGETLVGGYQGTEPPVAKPDPESPALAEQPNGGDVRAGKGGRIAKLRGSTFERTRAVPASMG